MANCSTIRSDLLAVYRSAVAAVDGQNVMRRVVERNVQRNELLIRSPSTGEVLRTFSDVQEKDIYVIGAGKSVVGMCVGFLKQLTQSALNSDANRLTVRGGVLSVPFGLSLSGGQLSILSQFNVEVYHGAKNNVPDEDAVSATNKILELVDKLGQSRSPSLVVAFVSGGGSALLCAPKAGICLARKREVIETLMKSGCGIESLNQVRQRLSEFKCGRLARRVLKSPNVQLLGLIASDIVDNPIDLVASGPTVLAKSSNPKEVCDILAKYHPDCHEEVIRLIKEDEVGEELNYEQRLTNVIVVSNEIALAAAKSEAKARGYEVRDLGHSITGEATSVAADFVKLAIVPEETNSSKGVIYIGGGETVVTVNENNCPGVGGRCQELGLKFEVLVSKESSAANFGLLAAGTDGQDGPTPVAGVIVTGDDKLNVQELEEAKDSLVRHDSYHFWKTCKPSERPDGHVLTLLKEFAIRLPRGHWRPHWCQRDGLVLLDEAELIATSQFLSNLNRVVVQVTTATLSLEADTSSSSRLAG